jgi:outer membrane biosynthesis protein TonB
MATTVNTSIHVNLQFDEEQEQRKNKRIAAIVTGILYALLIILFLFLGFSTPLPKPAPEGIEVMLGNQSFGKEQIIDNPKEATPQPVVQEQVVTPPQPQPAQPVINEQQVVTGNDDVAIKPVDKPAVKPSETKPTETKPNETTTSTPTPDPVVQKEPERTVDQGALFTKKPGQGGQGTTQDNAGDPTGTDRSKETGKSGSSTLDGTGSSGELGDGRKMLTRLKPEEDYQVRGKIVVEVVVDKDGTVLRARVDRGTTISNTSLQQKCIDTSYKQRFQANPAATVETIGRITYNFDLN